MGMFDSVYGRCPECNSPVEFQSKAGVCVLTNYSASSGVPPEIAKSIDGDSSSCDKCGTLVYIYSERPRQDIVMFTSTRELK